jgi:glycosyltransferase involved in cell wall biosynthesis
VRVLLITDWGPGEGGTERYVEALPDRLRKRGDEVALLTSSAGSAAAGRATFVAHGSRTRAGRAVTQVVNPAAFWTVRRAVANFRPDVAHVNMFLSFLSPTALAGLGDVRAVVTLHDYRAICPIGSNVLPDGTPCPHRPGAVCRQEGCIGGARRLREAARFAFIRRALARAACVLSDSAWMESTLAAAGIRTERLALPVQPPDAATPERAPHPLFVYGGRLEPEKGVDGLVRAFARLRRSHPDAELRICGDGGELARLQQLAADLSCPVAFLPATPGDGWWRAAFGAWAVVVPSVWEEPFGLVPIESITRGLPVIASDSGGMRESVRHGRTGLLYPRGDHDALAERLEAVATRTALAGRLPSEDVAEVIARHDPDAHIERLREVYAEAAAT